MEQSTRPKRPQRAMQPKNYKDPSSSESESEYSACTYKREKSKVQVYKKSTCALLFKLHSGLLFILYSWMLGFQHEQVVSFLNYE